MAKTKKNGADPLVWIIGLGSLFFMGSRLLGGDKKDARQAAAKKAAGFGGNDLRRYFNLGASGFRAGLSESWNPYDPDGWQYKAWLRGWRYAKALHTPQVV